MIIIKALYVIAAFGLALYGVQAAILSVLYLIHRKKNAILPHMERWPSVTLQLPLYNEIYVVERLLRAVTRIKYPAGRLQIQVIDDSTDETTDILAHAVERYRRAGHNMQLIHRQDRVGFKAGALHAALAEAEGELIAIFDADFVPPPDFLLRTVPFFSTDERLGIVQARWGHTNPTFSSLTRAQAIALDGHFIVEQTGRQRGGLFMSFNGTAGIWRKQCIEESGGWSADTLCEDLDLSYRAQIAGWKCLFLPDVAAPAEIPPQMAALKRQQSRWAQGTVQCLLKLWKKVLRSDKSLPARLLGLVHMGSYIAHPLGLLLLLCTIPMLFFEGGIKLHLAWLSLASMGPPIMHSIAQHRLYPDWKGRLLRFPILMLIGTGLAWKNSGAVLKAILGKKTEFNRTPKFRLGANKTSWEGRRYTLGWDWSNFGEIMMMLYAGLGIAVALLKGNPYVVPFLILYFFGFAYVGLYDGLHRVLWKTRGADTTSRRPAAVQPQGAPPLVYRSPRATPSRAKEGRHGVFADYPHR